MGGESAMAPDAAGADDAAAPLAVRLPRAAALPATAGSGIGGVPRVAVPWPDPLAAEASTGRAGCAARFARWARSTGGDDIAGGIGAALVRAEVSIPGSAVDGSGGGPDDGSGVADSTSAVRRTDDARCPTRTGS